MSVTIAEIKGEMCACGERIPNIYVDLLDCGKDGLTLKLGNNWIDLTPQMVADLVDALVDWQNREFR